jgi:hypothetical protein
VPEVEELNDGELNDGELNDGELNDEELGVGLTELAELIGILEAAERQFSDRVDTWVVDHHQVIVVLD